jgi:type VI secretion system protein ImpK
MGPEIQQHSGISGLPPLALSADFTFNTKHKNANIAKTLLSHHTTAGLNPIVDAAANLFTMLGQLKKIDHHHNLAKLQQELIKQIQSFQHSAKEQGYSSEQILLGRYALCATYDDVIKNQSWGANGLWDKYSLLDNFHPDHALPERFFIILDRLTKDPGLFIDILELMYICLSLGFCGPYRLKLANNEEQPHKKLLAIMTKAYQVIRVYRGEFNTLLAPQHLRVSAHDKLVSYTAILGKTVWLTTGIVFIMITALSYSLINKLDNLNVQVKNIQAKD